MQILYGPATVMLFITKSDDQLFIDTYFLRG